MLLAHCHWGCPPPHTVCSISAGRGDMQPSHSIAFTCFLLVISKDTFQVPKPKLYIWWSPWNNISSLWGLKTGFVSREQQSKHVKTSTCKTKKGFSVTTHSFIQTVKCAHTLQWFILSYRTSHMDIEKQTARWLASLQHHVQSHDAAETFILSAPPPRRKSSRCQWRHGWCCFS